MHLHEYQAKELLAEYGVPSPPFVVADTVDEAVRLFKTLEIEEGVAKIQVHAGGRGKAGGVKMFKGQEGLRDVAKRLLGFKMVNRQTGPLGVVAEKILIGPLTTIEKEYYVGITIDRQSKRLILLASPEGGMEIEEAGKVLTIPLLDRGPLLPFQEIELAKFMGWGGELSIEGARFCNALLHAFRDLDASMVEINPLVLSDQKLLALDAKITIDDNALYRHPTLQKLEDLSQLPEEERLARKAELAYISLDGDIGCMVNGAGLAMATMDMILLYGGKPANFLDVGGGASVEKISEGFKILLNDKRVKAILINIFGGIMNCASIADGVIDAIREMHLKVPLVVRMEGTNVEEGRKKLQQSKLPIVSTSSLKEAAEAVVQKARS